MIFTILLMCKIVTSCANSNFVIPYCITKVNTRLNKGIFLTYSPTGLQHCANDCLSRQLCTSFNYNRLHLTCELIKDTNGGNVQVVTSYVHVSKSTCQQATIGNCNMITTCGLITCPSNMRCIVLEDGAPICILSECDAPPVINNAIVSYTEIVVGGKTTYSCIDNYKVVGNPNIVCLSDGSWSNEEFECKRCDPAPVVKNAVVSYSDVTLGGTTTYSCTNNCLLYGSPFIYCQTNGLWSTVTFECKACCRDGGYTYIEELSACFKLYGQKTSWSSAKSTCQADNAELLVIKDENFYNIFKTEFNDQVSNLQNEFLLCGSPGEIWTGGNDRQNEGVYKWTNGLSFTTWQKSILIDDNLSCFPIANADCLMIKWNTGKLMDKHCTLNLPFVCMRNDDV